MNKEQRIEEIKKKLAQVTDDAERKSLTELLAKWEGGTSPSQSATPSSVDQIVQLATLIQASGGMDDDDVRQIAERVFASSQISYGQLSPEIIDFIDKSRTTTIQMIGVTTPEGITETTAKSQGTKSNLYWVVICDALAGNNVYLYGSAGTGKSYMAKQIASHFQYKLITINCNQFTSPLEIIGGQTIEGYQEGKLTQAWGNLDLGKNPATGKEYLGAVLLIDELPKLDPNTAGVLNDALSKVKDPEEVKDGQVIPKIIFNGKNEPVAKKNIFIMGTGNTLLLRPDPTYTANFSQDASLQDRFAGSTYRVYYNYEIEYNDILTLRNKELGGSGVVYQEINFAFLFNFLISLRQGIDSLNYNNEAFISARIMANLRDTYLRWRINQMSPNPPPVSKTLKDGILSFLGLFTDVQLTNLKARVEIDKFLNEVLPDIDTRPLDELSTPSEKKQANDIVKKYMEEYGNKLF